MNSVVGVGGDIINRVRGVNVRFTLFALGGGLYWLLHVFYWVFGSQFYEVLAPNDSENYRFCGSNLPTFTDWQTVPVFSSVYCWTQALLCIFVKTFKYFQVLFMFYINIDCFIFSFSSSIVQSTTTSYQFRPRSRHHQQNFNTVLDLRTGTTLWYFNRYRQWQWIQLSTRKRTNLGINNSR